MVVEVLVVVEVPVVVVVWVCWQDISLPTLLKLDPCGFRV